MLTSLYLVAMTTGWPRAELQRQRPSELWVLDVANYLLSDAVAKETVAEWEWIWPVVENPP